MQLGIFSKGDLVMFLKNIVKIGLASLLAVCGSTVAISADDKNYAYQLQLKNCGAYQLNYIKLQRKKAGSSSWMDEESWTTDGSEMGNGKTFCVDIRGGTYSFKPGDKARLKAYISGGEVVNCDSTNYGEATNQKSLRKMKMSGTTFNNNGCRTQSYGTPYKGSSSKCSHAGSRTYTGAC